MYQEHFGLSQEPFSIAPDPSFLYLSEAHNEALAHLVYGFTHGGFVMVSGEVGTGKTTLLRNLLDRTPPEVDVAFILNPRLTVRELLETLCEELGIPLRGEVDSVKGYIDALNRHLLTTHQAGRSTVAVIDEAQNLTPAVLEQIRLLTNLETNEKKLLRIILLGQPELTEMLAKPELRQLSQRITARYHLVPLDRDETAQYVQHRLRKAGGNPGIFSPRALGTLYRLSGGTPRLINVIADRALLGAYVRGEFTVTPQLVKQAAKEVFGKPKTDRPLVLYVSAAIVAVTLLTMAWAWFTRAPGASDVAATEPTPTAAVTELDPRDDPNLPAPPAAEAETSTSAVTRAPVTITRPDIAAFRLQRTAFSRVFERWGADYSLDDTRIPCDFAPTVGLQCLRRNGGWRELLDLDTPVVLELWDDEPNPFYGALLSADGDAYVLDVGNDRYSIVPDDLRDRWFGTYVLLWQTPPSYGGNQRQGDRHPSVAWLRESLARTNTPAPLSDREDVFDQGLRQAVLAFQRSHGLLADGVVGPLTWIHLHREIGQTMPTLR